MQGWKEKLILNQNVSINGKKVEYIKVSCSFFVSDEPYTVVVVNIDGDVKKYKRSGSVTADEVLRRFFTDATGSGKIQKSMPYVTQDRDNTSFNWR
jgi:hypothetical protein